MSAGTSSGGTQSTSGGSAPVGGGNNVAGTGADGGQISGNGGTSGTGGVAAGGSSGSAGSGRGGTSGGGGLPNVPDNGCDVKLTDKPIGFASMAGGTIGGGNAAPISVNTADELKMYLADNQPRVLHVMKDLDFRTANRSVQICADNVKCSDGNGGQTDDPRVSSACGSDEHTATGERNEAVLTVASNKTVIGIGTAGSGAALRGASLRIGASQQVILRNLKIYDVNPGLVEAGDGVTLLGAKFVWLDHLFLSQISDGSIDIGNTNGSTRDENITLSWVHFDGRAPKQCGGKHHFINLVDNAHVTYHHNWYDNSSGRNPKLGGEATQAHLFNNYWLNVTYFCITAQQDSEARVESNYFENSVRPHWLQTDGNGTAGIAIDNGNVYTGASMNNRDTGGTVFTVPYEYTKQTAEQAKASIVKCSGPQPIR